MRKRTFLRAFSISLVIIFCLSIGFLGITSAYEGIRRVGFGENRSALSIEDREIKIFDYSFHIKL